MAAKTDPDEYRMSFGDHLEELRSRLVKAMLGVLLTAILTFSFGKDVIAWLTEPLMRAQIAAGLSPQTITPTVTAGFFIYIKISLIGALIVAAPWVLYQMWKFVEAGLYHHERKVVYILAPFSTVMMMLGVAFMYYVMLPVTLAFLLFFAVGFGPAGGQSKDPLQFLSDTVSQFAGKKEDKPKEKLVDDAAKDGGEKEGTAKDGATKDGIETPVTPIEKPVEKTDEASDLENLPLAGRVPELDADPVNPQPGQVWVNRKQNQLKIQVDGKTLVAYLAVSSMVSPLIDLAQYIDFVLFMTLGIVVAFQMPVAMMVVGWTGILTAQMIKPYRKHMFFVCFCMGAVITPSSDPLSMTVMATPLYILFELGLLLMKLTQRPRSEEDDDDWDDDDDDEWESDGDSDGEEDADDDRRVATI